MFCLLAKINILLHISNRLVLVVLLLCVFFAFMFSLFSLLLYVFIDVRLSHLNKDYLLTYLLTYSASTQRNDVGSMLHIRGTATTCQPDESIGPRHNTCQRVSDDRKRRLMPDTIWSGRCTSMGVRRYSTSLWIRMVVDHEHQKDTKMVQGQYAS